MTQDRDEGKEAADEAQRIIRGGEVSISEEEKMEFPFPCEFEDPDHFYVLTHFLEEIEHFSEPGSQAQLLYERFNNYEGYSRTRPKYVVPISASEINRIGATMYSLREMMGPNGVIVNQSLSNLSEAYRDLVNGYKSIGGLGKLKDFEGEKTIK